jgi:hypothetical protein
MEVHGMNWLRRLFSKKRKVIRSGKLCCSDCGVPIHKHDRYRIREAQHVNCSDPKMVGQRSISEVIK